MSEILETVKVKDERAPGGYFLLNKSDFDPAKQELFEEPAPPTEGDQKPPEGPKLEGKGKK